MPDASVKTDLVERREAKAEMAALDALPPAVRRAIIRARAKIAVRVCADLLANGETEEFVIEAIRLVDRAKCAEYRRMMASGAFTRPKETKSP